MTAHDVAKSLVEACAGDAQKLALVREVLSIVSTEVAHEREACAKLIEGITLSEVLLAAGEMTARERRTVKALLPWLANKIRNRVPK